MTRKIIFFSLFLLISGLFSLSHSQFLPSLALAGGPSAGWHFNDTKDLNLELKNAGFPEMSENGFFTLGGGGFIDLPMQKKNFIRISGFGSGFTSKQSKRINDTLTKATNYSLGQGGIGLEYIIPLGNMLDITIGALFSTGTLKLELYQYGNDYGSYNTIFGELTSNGTSSNLSRVFRSRFYSVQPQVGLGLMLRKFLYLKIDVGYQLSSQGTWRVDNDVEVENFPETIKSNGLIINAGLNFGIFFRD
ncbi:MAG: hypothetical protein L0Y79_03420 [Chlorobi bacterium]|nr:hypothetical protein [Chlorobiota bacterium]MCI0715943.1 hypothetical protein [Chlorobiota bacterium]